MKMPGAFAYNRRDVQLAGDGDKRYSNGRGEDNRAAVERVSGRHGLNVELSDKREDVMCPASAPDVQFEFLRREHWQLSIRVCQCQFQSGFIWERGSEGLFGCSPRARPGATTRKRFAATQVRVPRRLGM